ncbi:hypothetical protein LINGRAHAP2_LOCUS14739 [Linum grandiflorum]
MEPDIGDNYLLHQSAKALWDDVKETYSTQDNSSKLFEIEQKLYNFKQGEMSATDYYNKLGRTWLELDLYEAQTWTNTADAKTFCSFVEKKRTIQMLLGLNQELDAAKSRVMGTKPFPSLKEAFAEVLREEDRRHLMIGTTTQVPSNSALKTEVSPAALAVQNYRGKGKLKNNSDAASKWCDLCQLPFHTKEECWEIIGGPPGWTSKLNRQRPRANPALNKADADPQFSKGQLETLQKMFTQVLQAEKTEAKPKGYISRLFEKQGSEDGEDGWMW